MKRRGQQLTNVNRSLAPIPTRFITKMKYSETFSLSALADTQVMNLNSIFDPNRTGIGHQPYGFDQLAILYNRYRVIATSYVINAYSDASIRFTAIPTNDLSLSLANNSQIIESPRARFKVQYPGGSTQYLKGKVYLPALVGRTKTQYMSDDRYQAQTNTSPNEQALLSVKAQTMTDVSTNVSLTITLEYLVEFFDVNQLGQS